MKIKGNKCINLNVKPELHERIVRYQGKIINQRGKKISLREVCTEAVEEKLQQHGL